LILVRQEKGERKGKAVLTFRLRQGSQEKALFLVAFADVDISGVKRDGKRKKRRPTQAAVMAHNTVHSILVAEREFGTCCENSPRSNAECSLLAPTTVSEACK
jgi:hypothetical protein